MYDIRNKKILILGGSHQHVKLVKAAKNAGVITYVTDFLPISKSPAKQIADFPLMYNITDIDNLVELCKKEKIDGVIASHLDVTQRPYQELCEKLNLPCFGDKEQHKILTDKIEFKKFCKKFNGSTIDSYSEDEIINSSKKVVFPILVKPNDSRGSRGQTICNTVDEAIHAISYAKEYSNSKEVVIERYMGSDNDVEIAYFVIDGEPIFLRILDRFLGSTKNKLDKLAIAEIFPSRFYSRYIEKIDEKIKKIIKDIKLVNSPVFFQAFIDNDVARLYDPGIRLPGDNFDDIYNVITGIDIADLLIKYSLTGKISKEYANNLKNARANKPSAMIWPCLRPGTISLIQGFDELLQNKNYISVFKAYNVGDTIIETNDVRQRFGEFCITCSSFKEMKKIICDLFSNLKVLDENGDDMLIEKFDISNLDEYDKLY